MCCPICGRNSCTTSFHSFEEQEKFEKVIEMHDKMCELRQQIQDEEE